MPNNNPMTLAFMAEVCDAALLAMQSNGLANRTERLQQVRDQLRAMSEAPTQSVLDEPWTLVSDRLPTHEEFGPYPTVDVILQCARDNGRPPMQRRVGHAQLRYLGGDRNRPIWTDENANHIENGSWFATHWRRIPKYPEPVDAGGA